MFFQNNYFICRGAGRGRQGGARAPPWKIEVDMDMLGFSHILELKSPLSATHSVRCALLHLIIDREAGVALTATQRMRPMAQIPYCDVVFTAVCTTYRVFWSLEGKNLAKWTLEISLNVDKFAEDLRKMRLKWWLVKIFKTDFWAPPPWKIFCRRAWGQGHSLWTLADA